MSYLGNILTLFLIPALLARGTGTQGDDDAWAGSFYLFTPVVALGIVILLYSVVSKRDEVSIWLIHIVSVILSFLILPSYWYRVTFKGDHILAGFDESLANSFEPESWHKYWAPVLSLLSLLLMAMLVKQCWSNNAQQTIPDTPPAK